MQNVTSEYQEKHPLQVTNHTSVGPVVLEENQLYMLRADTLEH